MEKTFLRRFTKNVFVFINVAVAICFLAGSQRKIFRPDSMVVP